MQLPQGVPSAGSALGDCPGFFSAVSAGALCGISPIIIMLSSELPLELKLASNWSGWAVMGQLVGKEKPLFSTLWIFWRPCAGKQPRCVSEELYFGSTWVKPAEKNQLHFHKTFLHPSTNMFQHSGELTAMSDTDAAERPPHKTVLCTFTPAKRTGVKVG